MATMAITYLFLVIDRKTLWSIDNMCYVSKMKRNVPNNLKVKDHFVRNVYEPYVEAVQQGDPNALLTIADRVDVAPALVAKRVLEHIYMSQLQPTDQKTETKSATVQNTKLDEHSNAALPENSEAPHTELELSSKPSTSLKVCINNTDLPSIPLSHSAATDSTPVGTTSTKTVESASSLKPAQTHNEALTSALDDGDGSSSQGSGLSALARLNSYALSHNWVLRWKMVSLEEQAESSCESWRAELRIVGVRGVWTANAQTKRLARQHVSLEALDALISRIKPSALSVSLSESASLQIGQGGYEERLESAESRLRLTNVEGREGGEDLQINKQTISEWLKKPHLIPDRLLSHHVTVCVTNDTQFGPIPLALHSNIGHEYEQLLFNKVNALQLKYKDEAVLRNQGYDKTPDVKLDVPIAVNGKVVNWIESKASFGDDSAHNKYLRTQLWSYWNRFGPGLVIYWFGYIAELENSSEGILIMDRFPKELVTFSSQ